MTEFTHPTRIAAFKDCVASFEANEFVGVCETRMRYLRTALEASGHDWTERVRRLEDALRDSYNALYVGGALDPPHVGEPTHIDEAGLSVEERLCLCETIVTAEPPIGDAVVWMVYASARLSQVYLQKGPVEFYDHGIWSAVVAGSWPGNPGWTQPPELAHPFSSLFFHGLPQDDFVIVRVPLENTPIAEAGERGRDLARAALELTGWDSDWVLMDGAAIYASGGWFGSTGFLDPREELKRLNFPITDPAFQVLAELDSELLTRIAAHEPAALDLVSDIRWRRAAASVPDAEHRVSLLIALFERVLVPSSVGTDKWYGACRSYFEHLLAHDDVVQQINDAGYYGVQSLERTSAGASDYRAFHDAIIDEDGRSFRVRPDRAIQMAPSLLEHVEQGSIEARMLDELVQMTRDGAATLAWLRAASARFRRLLERARRQRNAVTHGIRTVPEVVASVEPFLDRLAGRLIGALHYCVDEGLDLTTELQAWKVVRLKKRDGLAAAAAPESFLI